MEWTSSCLTYVYELSLERLFVHQHFEEEAAEAPDVDLEGIPGPVAQFRRHVEGGAHVSGREVFRSVQLPRDSEVCQLGLFS